MRQWVKKLIFIYKSALRGHGHEFGQKLFFNFNVYITSARQPKFECHSLSYKRVEERTILAM